jgi:ApbE superfamily uncharacterized protein (UPF0280 family)
MLPQLEITEPIRVLAEDLILVDWGPMTLTISAWYRNRPRPVIASKAAATALECLKTLADFHGFMKLPTSDIPKNRPRPDVVERACSSARAVSGDLTSLAAVAGSVADQVADAALELGADKVIVNNGGDTAIRLRGPAVATVGVKRSGDDAMIGRLTVTAESDIGGVASSGWSGRSHSPGVADLVTVWAENAALADAAATHIAGAAQVRSSTVQQRRATDVDPMSDLGDMLITTAVGRLTPGQRRKALNRGTSVAEKLCAAGIIRGAIIRVQQDSAILDLAGEYSPESL